MFKKYCKLACLFFITVFLTTLYAVGDTFNPYGPRSATGVGSFEYPSPPNFDFIFGGTISILYMMGGIMSFFIFTELRSQKVGGFIASLPVKKTRIYLSIMCAGILFITLSFIPMLIFFYNQLGMTLTNIQQIFIENGRYAEGFEVVSKARENSYITCIQHYFISISVYCVLTFVQVMFQKPVAAFVALIGGTLGSWLCIMTVDKYFVVLNQSEISARIINVLYWRRIFYGDSRVAETLKTMSLIMAISFIVFLWGMWLFQNDGRSADNIFTFPAVRRIMLIGVTCCSGSLAVFLFFRLVGIENLSLGLMNLFFAVTAFIGWAVTRKIFKTMC